MGHGHNPAPVRVKHSPSLMRAQALGRESHDLLRDAGLTLVRTAAAESIPTTGPGSVVMNLMYRLSAIIQAEIGRKLGGLDYTIVSRERKRLRDKMAVDCKLRGAMEKLERRLIGND